MKMFLCRSRISEWGRLGTAEKALEDNNTHTNSHARSANTHKIQASELYRSFSTMPPQHQQKWETSSPITQDKTEISLLATKVLCSWNSKLHLICIKYSFPVPSEPGCIRTYSIIQHLCIPPNISWVPGARNWGSMHCTRPADAILM